MDKWLDFMQQVIMQMIMSFRFNTHLDFDKCAAHLRAAHQELEIIRRRVIREETEKK